MELVDRSLQTVIGAVDDARSLLNHNTEHLETIRLACDRRQEGAHEVHVRSKSLHELCGALPALADEQLKVPLVDLVRADTKRLDRRNALWARNGAKNGI